MQDMFDRLIGAGIPPARCQAYVYGGGNMFPGNQHARGHQAIGLSVGQRNGEAARELLKRHGIAVATESLFGVGHRQIIFDISKGDVWSRQVRPSPIEIDAETSAQGN